MTVDDVPTSRRRLPLSGWAVFAPAVVCNALVQAVGVAATSYADGSWWTWLLVLASALSLVTLCWLVTAAAAARAEGRPRRAWRSVGQRVPLIPWTAGSLVLAGAVDLGSPVLASVVLLAASVVVAAAAVGATRPPLAALRLVVTHPWRALAHSVLFLILAVLGFAGALLASFFVAGATSALLTWMWLGLVVVMVMVSACRLALGDRERLNPDAPRWKDDALRG